MFFGKYLSTEESVRSGESWDNSEKGTVEREECETLKLYGKVIRKEV